MYGQYVTLSLTLLIGLTCIIGLTYLSFYDDRPTKESKKSDFLNEGIHRLGKGIFKFQTQWKINEYIYDIRSHNTRGILISWASNAKKFEIPFINAEAKSDALDRPYFTCSTLQSKSSPNLSCQKTESKFDDFVGNRIDLDNPNWTINRTEFIFKTLSSENHYNEDGIYTFSYMFDTGVAIHENGKIDRDNTVLFVKGYITFTLYSRIVQLKYSKTRDAAYDVQLRIDDLGDVYAANRFHKEARFLLPIEESTDSSKIKFRDGINFNIFRERSRHGPSPTIEATVTIRVSNLASASVLVNAMDRFAKNSI